jgi:hypothetical protein
VARKDEDRKRMGMSRREIGCWMMTAGLVAMAEIVRGAIDEAGEFGGGV